MQKLILILLLTTSVFSQKVSSIPILKNNNALITVEKYIECRKIEFKKFQTEGYVTIQLLYFNSNAINKEIKYKFKIKDQYFIPSASGQEQYTYAGYTKVNNKLVLYMNDDLLNQKNSKKKIKKYLKKIKKTLAEPKKIELKDSTGKIIAKDNFFIDQSYNIHGGKIFTIDACGDISVEN